MEHMQWLLWNVLLTERSYSKYANYKLGMATYVVYMIVQLLHMIKNYR